MKTCDLVDHYQDIIQVAKTIGLRHYGGLISFSGQIQTIQCVDDNSLIKQTLSTSGDKRVLVVDAGGSMNCALMGDVIARLAVSNNWSGVVINGCIRDSLAMSKLNLGVLALGTNPQRSAKEFKGIVGESLQFAGVQFVPGQYLYADEDGFLVSPKALT
jgi:regulator of ribonuclease activity A